MSTPPEVMEEKQTLSDFAQHLKEVMGEEVKNMAEDEYDTYNMGYEIGHNHLHDKITNELDKYLKI